MRRSDRALRVAVCGLLLAMMLVLGWVESLLPAFGVPGVKLGLSNGVLIFAVYMLDIPTAFILMALKVALSGMLFGNPSAMAYAFAGGLTSLTVMCLLSRVKGLSRVIVSMAGGLAHNVGQVAMAMLILNSPRQMLYYMAILMGVGLACGALTGIAADAVLRHLRSARWSAPRGTDRRRSGALLLAAAVLVIAVGAFAIVRMRRPAEVTVTVQPAVTEAGRP